MINEQHIQGRRFITYGQKDGSFKRWCGSRTFNLSITKEIKKATKPTTSKAASNYYGELSYSITSGGLCALDTGENMTHDDLIKMQIDEVPLMWMGRSLDHSEVFYAGTAIISNVGIDANLDDMMLYNFSAVGDGDLILTNPYEIRMLQTRLINGEPVVLGNFDGEQTKIIIQYITGGLPPIIN